MHEPHLLAGQFGAATRLSPKALRLYADQGLLVPAHVDPATGYRCYHPEQVHRARLIARLRRLDLPLARIALLLDLVPAARDSELRGWLRAKQDELAVYTELVAAVTSQDDRDRDLIEAVSLRSTPATKLLVRQKHVFIDVLDEFMNAAGEEIRAHLRASSLPGEAVTRVYFHDMVTRDSEGLVEVAIAYEGSVEPAADMRIRLAPASTEAYLAVPAEQESFPLILRVYDAIEAWMDGRPGVTCVGPRTRSGRVPMPGSTSSTPSSPTERQL